ncbi:ATP-binding cassette domain-containing protein [Lactobacillus xylocopicola]|uniref:ABC transporter ATP-binding protein n=1 Tax=Lactobacillus xylocopicola TaxID=2976676 RepID=A0ABN6SN59_9LACO|nr:ATP-binding cassette domain-containing protein [Lactobacillus xylocopicola]BDR61198.1 ABC transporter ATP-binding protein [Lactobacillus xylocopicola]
MEYLKMTELRLEYQGEELFKVASLNVQEGQHVGLIGANGVGKTTLLKVLNEEAVVFNITGQIRRNCQIVRVPQILTYDEESGGEREKAAIITALRRLRQYPRGLLLLDEPTSNLDTSQQAWLIKLLNGLSQPVIIVSHDRNFLKQTSNTIWQVKDHKVSAYKGTYDEFVTVEKKKEENQAFEYLRQEKKICKLKEAQKKREVTGRQFNKKKKNISWSDWKDKKRHLGGTQKRILRSSKVLDKRVERETNKLQKPVTHQPITLNNFKVNDLALPAGSTMVRIQPQEVTIGSRKLFTIAEQLKVKNGSKVALVGPNGSGKSVFLNKLWQDQLKQWVNPQAKIGFFQQNMTQEITDNKTVQNEIQRVTIFDNAATMQLLGDLHLRPFLTRQVCHLSGGQLICFKLAKVLLGKHNLLILDEPTNFLDLPAITALEEFIKNYPFAVIIVSHDQEFLANLNLVTWHIRDHQLVLPTTFVNHKNTQTANQIELLRFKRDQLLSEPGASMGEIQKISREINKLQDK